MKDEEENSPKPKPLYLVLDPNGVAAPAQRVATIASQVVGTCLRALATDDLSIPELHAKSMGFQFTGFDMTLEERRETFQNWILSKGFQDLARGVRETLEEAFYYINLLRLKTDRTTMGHVEAEMAVIRANAAKLLFPSLLKEVNANLIEPVAFETEFLSLQKARNCLEHRSGRVGSKDIDPACGFLRLTFPRLRFFYRRGIDEVELAPGEILDTHSVDDWSSEQGEVPIYMHRVIRYREYALDQQVVITASDFYEIAFACHLFASDLAKKLPKPPTSVL